MSRRSNKRRRRRRHHDPNAQVRRGVALQKAGDVAGAIGQYRAVLQAEPRHPGAWYFLALASYQLGDRARAKEYFRASLQAEPRNPDAWYNLGKMHHDLGETAEALECYMAALEQDDQHTHALSNAGHLFLSSGDLKAARACWDRALAQDPNSAEAKYNKSFLKLLHGDLEGGWRDYEYRWLCPTFFLEYGRSDVATVPMWMGVDVHPIEGKTLYVHGEQGLGDVIQMLRFLPQLEQLGARIICEVFEPLVRLAQASFPTVEFRPRGRADVSGCDYHLPSMSLPSRFGGHHPREVPYLRVPPDAAVPERVAEWIRATHADGRRALGIVWAGSRTHPGDHQRSIDVDALAPLWDDANRARWLSLQIGDRGDQVAATPCLDVRDLVSDFADSAAIVQALDGVVCVDTSTAHLCGALGLRTLLLLPPVPDYRWLLEGDTTHLYPTVTLCRRRGGEAWVDTLHRVARGLALNHELW